MQFLPSSHPRPTGFRCAGECSCRHRCRILVIPPSAAWPQMPRAILLASAMAMRGFLANRAGEPGAPGCALQDAHRTTAMAPMNREPNHAPRHMPADPPAKLQARQLLAKCDSSVSRRSMQLKHVFCQTFPTGASFHFVALSMTNLAHCDVVGEGWHPPHLETISQMSDDPLISPASPGTLISWRHAGGRRDQAASYTTPWDTIPPGRNELAIGGECATRNSLCTCTGGPKTKLSFSEN